MKSLQKQLNQFLFNWQPEDSVKFVIPIKYTAGDILEIVERNGSIVGASINEEYRVSFQIGRGLLFQIYRSRQIKVA